MPKTKCKVTIDTSELEEGIRTIGSAIEGLFAGPQYRERKSGGRAQYLAKEITTKTAYGGGRVDVAAQVRQLVNKDLIRMIKARYEQASRGYYAHRAAVDTAIGLVTGDFLEASSEIQMPPWPKFTATDKPVSAGGIKEQIFDNVQIETYFWESKPGFEIRVANTKALDDMTMVESKTGAQAPLWRILEFGAAPHAISPVDAKALALYRHGANAFILMYPGEPVMHPGQDGRHFFLDAMGGLFNEDRRMFQEKMRHIIQTRLNWFQRELRKPGNMLERAKGYGLTVGRRERRSPRRWWKKPPGTAGEVPASIVRRGKLKKVPDEKRAEEQEAGQVVEKGQSDANIQRQEFFRSWSELTTKIGRRPYTEAELTTLWAEAWGETGGQAMALLRETLDGAENEEIEFILSQWSG